MHAAILSYFTGIFASNNLCCDDSLFDDFAPRVSDEQNVMLDRPFNGEEVKTTLFSMFPDKAPGPDGMNSGFYQQFWSVVGEDVTRFIMHALNSGEFPEGLNDTNIILIPKKEVPETVADLRPIALSNVIYRIMAKMLTNRMKTLMSDLISESQSAFIPSRLITDNILVAAEVGHYLNRKQCGAVGWSALKLDMSKAYDRMEWKFLERMLVVLGFSEKWIQLIMLCVTTVNYTVMVNRCLEVEQADNFGKYLGLPSFVGRNKRAVFAYVEEKIRQRIGSWSKKMLSQAGKEVLLKSVAQSMPTFSMSIFLLPETVCQSIERTMNKFWWGSGRDRGIHWKAWDMLCVPKKYGGLSFKELRAFNLAMLGKQAWRFLTNPGSLATRIYKARYYPTTGFVDATIGRCLSFCWRSIMAAHPTVTAGVRRRIGNGQSTLIWGHPWLPDGPSPLIQTNILEELREARVTGLIDPQSSTWDPHILSDIFIPEDVNRILKIPVSPDYDDSWYWMGDPKGTYTVKNAYRRIVGDFESNPGTFD
ncbi:PREDICTED: uncharacterized protein LOC109181235 [Ipomoea nil]|uniref:uncharacterized protein LOC109181235 n=1 Tax=Ipomoea nil TaxID=35883 RepID=UPI000900EAEC|nr:PREDICTED: uncharacterized protein LOC109181235 [Ipomoea nil]